MRARETGGDPALVGWRSSGVWDDVADVVVVGGGAAGFAATLTAAADGAEVALLEKASSVGGTTVKSSATMWIPNNPVMRRLGLEDPRDWALRFMARVAYPARYDAVGPTLGLSEREHALLAAFYDRGAEAFTHLDAMGVLGVDEAEATTFPDYHARLPEDAAPVGRSLRIAVPEGWRYGLDTTGGQMMVDRMAAAAAARGARTRLDCRVGALVFNEGGEVVGVQASQRGVPVLVGARHGVVFASGGFLHNAELRRELLRGLVFGGAAAETATGDFVAIAAQAGARMGAMGGAWWDQVVLELAIEQPITGRDVLWPFGDSMLMVNRHGERVVDEKLPYAERGPIHFNWDPVRGEYPNLLLMMIYDEHVARDNAVSRFRYPIPPPGETASYVITGDDWTELAERLAQRLRGLRSQTGGYALAGDFAERLRASVERFNGFARTGRDVDFARGEQPIEQVWNRQGQTDPSPTTMRPLADAGPYHCVILAAGALDTNGGPLIDEDARVLGADGRPIPGLFGAGNCIGSPVGGGYFGPGGTIGPALTFGYIASRSALHEPPRWAPRAQQPQAPLRPLRV